MPTGGHREKGGENRQAAFTSGVEMEAEFFAGVVKKKKKKGGKGKNPANP